MTSRCVIDVGNTSIASAFFTNDDLISPQRIGTRHVSIVHDVADLIDGVRTRSKGNYDEIVVCVGVASIRSLFEEYAHNNSVDIHFVSGHNLSGARIAYETPETLGPDRIANTIAVEKLYSQPTFVIDCGTAITLDLVDAQGTFVGGMIAPGIEISRDALTHFAPSLPDVALVAPGDLIETNTIACIQSGVINGAAAMIDSVIAQVSKENPSLEIVVTGGHSSILVPLLRSRVVHDEWLTLRGLGFATTS